MKLLRDYAIKEDFEVEKREQLDNNKLCQIVYWGKG
jgi:hypothetical protein